MKFSQNKIFLFLLCTSSLALVIAYIAEFIFQLTPCKLCLYERIPYFIIILLSILGMLLCAHLMRFLCIMTLLANAALSAYHVTVEFGWNEDRCSAHINTNVSSIEEVLMDLSGEFTNSCAMPEFVFLGISIAGWNFVYCIFVCLFVIFISRNNKKLLSNSYE